MAYSTGTISNLKTKCRAYFLFCSYFRFKPLPATTEIVCLYAQFLRRSITPTIRSERDERTCVLELLLSNSAEDIYPRLSNLDVLDV